MPFCPTADWLLSVQHWISYISVL